MSGAPPRAIFKFTRKKTKIIITINNLLVIINKNSYNFKLSEADSLNA